MAEEAQLLLLRVELDKIRRGRRNAQILSYAIGVIVVVIVWGLQIIMKTNLITDFGAIIIWAIIGVIGWLIARRYYDAKEAQVVGQIKQLKRESSPDNQ
jgi:hypothetical protein